MGTTRSVKMAKVETSELSFSEYRSQSGKQTPRERYFGVRSGINRAASPACCHVLLARSARAAPVDNPAGQGSSAGHDMLQTPRWTPEALADRWPTYVTEETSYIMGAC